MCPRIRNDSIPLAGDAASTIVRVYSINRLRAVSAKTKRSPDAPLLYAAKYVNEKRLHQQRKLLNSHN
jgi:hypothetical protein